MKKMLKFLFDNNSSSPNVNSGRIYKNHFTNDNGMVTESMVEIDTTKVENKLNISKEEAKKITEVVVKSIWRMKITKR